MTTLDEIKGVDDITASIGLANGVIELNIDSAVVNVFHADFDSLQGYTGLIKQYGSFDHISDFSDCRLTDGFKHHAVQATAIPRLHDAFARPSREQNSQALLDILLFSHHLYISQTALFMKLRRKAPADTEEFFIYFRICHDKQFTIHRS